MKRQTGGTVRTLELEQNEVNERKKARLSGSSGEESVLNPNENSGVENGNFSDTPNTNGEFSGEPIPVKFAHIKTSTPMTCNGVGVKMSALYDQMSFCPESTPASSIVPGDTAEATTLLSTEISELEKNLDASLNSHSDRPLCSTESVSTESGGNPPGNSTDNEKQLLHGQDASNAATPVADKTSMSESPHLSSKLDAEYFLSSFLQTYELVGHSNCVTCVAADGDVILSASGDTTIKMWDPHGKKEVCNFQGHTGSVNALLLLSSEQTAVLSKKAGFDDVSRIVVSGSSDCTIRLWSVDEGKELQSLYTYNGIMRLGYFGTMNYVVIGTDGGKLEVWDLCSSKVVHSVIAHDDGITDLEVVDCYVYSTSYDGKVKVWLFEEDELQVIYTRSRKEAERNNSNFSPCHWRCVTSHDGLMYLGDSTPFLKILDWKAGRIRLLRNQHTPHGVTESICAKKDILLTTSCEVEESSSDINVWQLPSMTYICTMSGNIGSVLSLTITETADGILRVVSGGSKLIVWDYICSKKPSPGPDDEYFCHEIENLGEEISEKHNESQLSAHAKKSKAEDSKNHSLKCILL